MAVAFNGFGEKAIPFLKALDFRRSEIVDFTLRARPLLDWGRKIEGRVARTQV